MWLSILSRLPSTENNRFPLDVVTGTTPVLPHSCFTDRYTEMWKKLYLLHCISTWNLLKKKWIKTPNILAIVPLCPRDPDQFWIWCPPVSYLGAMKTVFLWQSEVPLLRWTPYPKSTRRSSSKTGLTLTLISISKKPLHQIYLIITPWYKLLRNICWPVALIWNAVRAAPPIDSGWG